MSDANEAVHVPLISFDSAQNRCPSELYVRQPGSISSFHPRLSSVSRARPIPGDG